MYLYFKYDKEYKVKKYKYYREIPYNLEPELLQMIYYGKITKNSFWITFLNLVKKGVFRIEKTTNEVGKETEKIVFQKDVDNLKQYQRLVGEIIIDCMPQDKEEIDILKLQSKMELESEKKYTEYVKKIDSEKKSLFGKDQKIPKRAIKILSVFMATLILLIVVMAFNNPVAKESDLGIMYIPYILVFILMQYVVRIKKSCKEERQIKEQLKGLRRYLKDYSLLSEKENIENVVVWEEYLILAIALGLNNKVINNWYTYGQTFMDSNIERSFHNAGGYTAVSLTMKPVFNSFVRVGGSSSSFSSSSGGFSGGSSSGGGGRRRRWRKFLLKPKKTRFL